MARFGSGVGADADVVRAAERAVRAALAPLAGRTPDLVCFFICSPDADDFALAAARVADLSGGRAVLGCTAAGVLAGTTVVESAAAVSVWAAVLPGAVVRTFHLEVMAVDDGLAVVGLPERGAGDDLALLLVEPNSFPTESFVDRLNTQTPGFALVGGVAGTQFATGQSMLFADGRCVDRGAVGVFLGGPVAAFAAVAQGCRAVGPAMVVTATDRNVVLSLAGMPAVAKLGEIIEQLPPDEQALASRQLLLGAVMDEYADDHDSGDFVIRPIVRMDDGSGGVLLHSAVPVGTAVRLHVPDAGAADDQLRDALASITTASGFDTVEGAVVFTARSRHRLFATDSHELDAVSEVLGAPAVAGLLTDGEVGPGFGRNRLHAASTTILAFGSGSAAARGTRHD